MLAFSIKDGSLLWKRQLTEGDAVGGGLENALLKFIRPDQVPAAVKIYRAYWDRTMLDDVLALPGALALLHDLHARGLTVAIFTNKHAPMAPAYSESGETFKCLPIFCSRAFTMPAFFVMPPVSVTSPSAAT